MSQSRIALKLMLRLGLVYSAWLGGFLCLKPLLAQEVVGDDTLPTPTRVIVDNQEFLIDQGTQSGSNLFHSFKFFSIPTDFKAVFLSTPGVQNTLARVTGNYLSNIDGLIQVDGTADFFLINPNGIIFGPNAALDVGGSFLATTAEQVRFSDNAVFNAFPVNSPSLLSLSTPSGLQFGEDPGEIVNQASRNDVSPNRRGLHVNPDQVLALIGGEIRISGGDIVSPQSHVKLGAVAEGSLVNLAKSSEVGYFFDFDYGNVNAYRDIQISSLATIDLSGIEGDQLVNNNGSINIRGKDIIVSGGSRILVDNFGNEVAGDVHITASDTFTVTGTASLDGPLANDGLVETLRRSRISSSTSRGRGKGADINVTAKRVSFLDGGILAAETRGEGTGGKISIQDSEWVEVSGQAPLIRVVNPLVVEQLAEFGGVNPDFFANGLTGSIISLTSFSSGQSGNLVIDTKLLKIRDGGLINLGPFSGVGGDAMIKAEKIEVVGTNPGENYPSAISVAVLPIPGATGVPGDLLIDTSILRIKDGGRLGLDTTTDSGALGKINAYELVEIAGFSSNGKFKSLISGRSSLAGVGGTVEITTADLRILDGGSIFVVGVSSSEGGDIQVTANSLLLDNDAAITTASGKLLGGNINLDIDGALIMRRGSRISAGAGEAGKGGNVSINAELIAAARQENNDIIATAEEGAGGNINIITKGILGFQTSGQRTPNSDISASSEVGVDGNVTINTPETEVDSTQVQLSETFAPPELAASCYVVQATDGRFVRTGRGGLPTNPVSPVAADNLWQDLEPLPSSSLRAQQQTMSPTSTSHLGQPAEQPKLKEAIAWTFAKDGKVQLVSSEDEGSIDFAVASTCSPN